MITIHFIAADGARNQVKAKPGLNLMQAAIDAKIKGIQADCGGLLTCGTCHVFIHEPFMGQLPAPDPDEFAMLEFTATPRQENSRLSCQIVLTDELDGMTVGTPAAQH